MPTMFWGGGMPSSMPGSPYTAAGAPGALHPQSQTLMYCYAPVSHVDQMYGMLPQMHPGASVLAPQQTRQIQSFHAANAIPHQTLCQPPMVPTPTSSASFPPYRLAMGLGPQHVTYVPAEQLYMTSGNGKKVRFIY